MLQRGAVLQSLPDEVQRALRIFVSQLDRLFGVSLETVLLYGSAARGEFLPGRSNLNLCILLSGCDASTLERYATIHRRWQKEGIVVPLFFTPEELHASAEWFPLEYLEMQDAYVVLKGGDPFTTRQVDLQRVRVESEQAIRSNLLRLRQRFVEGGGKAETVSILLPLSLTTLLPALRGLLHVTGRPVPGSTDLVLAELKPVFDLDPMVFEEVLRLKRGLITPGPLELPRMFERYHAALQALILRLAHLTESIGS